MPSLLLRSTVVSLLLICLSATAGQVSINNWSIGVNVGFGQRTSFITGQDDLAIYLLPDIQYYGEQVFFDNGTLGYTLTESEQVSWSLITELNPYGLYFERSALGESFNPLFLVSNNDEPQSFDSGRDIGLTAEPPELSIATSPTLAERDGAMSYHWPKPSLSLDAGLQLNWFINQTQSITAKVVKDINSKHSGLRAKVTWSKLVQWQQLQLVSAIGAEYLDAKASNYYFALTPQDAEFKTQTYQMGGSINPFISLSLSRPINDSLKLVSHIKYMKLASGISDSPVTDRSYTATYFLGLNYQF